MSTEKKSPGLTVVVIGVLLAALVGVLAGTSCTNVPKQIAEPAKVVADCGKKAVHDQASGILDDVASALITTDYSGGLRGIATNVAGSLSGVATEEAADIAWSAVACSVRELFKQSNTHLGYGTLDPQTAAREQLMRDHASAWLSSH